MSERISRDDVAAVDPVQFGIMPVAADNPPTNDGGHHGIASRKSPAAENSSAGSSQRRSRAMGWASTAIASSTAMADFAMGWAQNRPVNGAPGATRDQTTMSMSPYSAPTTAAARHHLCICRRYCTRAPAPAGAAPMVNA